MMELQFQYQKKRSEFGRQCMFNDRGPELIDNYAGNRRCMNEYINRIIMDLSIQNTPVQAEHELNTYRAEYTQSGMNHVEGGWPKDLNIADEEQTKRYRRKVEKDENYFHVMSQLCKSMEYYILQNNAMNIYQQYYTDVEPTPLVEPSSARTVNVFRDECSKTRPISHISWSPDGGARVAISHCNMDFQAEISPSQIMSYIWELENPNIPIMVINPPTQIVCLEYNQKDQNSLVSGQFSGQVAVWDVRKGAEPVELSVMEESHRDPVSSIQWINSKSGTEFFSGSTDGTVKWWDTRKMTEPTETLILDPIKEGEQSISNALGCSVLEYEPTIPTRFMVGTENGIVINCNRKGKLPSEKMLARYPCHLGPVLALQRNQAFLKNFLTIGDWCARIWSEDCKESAIMWTNYHKARLLDGCWSPTRYSLYFTARSDGVLDVWDILENQQHAAIGVKVCDEPLTKLRCLDNGRLVAGGNQKGTTYVIELSENLQISNKNDKALLTAMFERETRREKILEARNRELRLKMKTKSNIGGSSVVLTKGTDWLEDEEFMDPTVKQAEAEYKAIIEAELHPPEEVEEEEVIDDVITYLPDDNEEADEAPQPPQETETKE